MSANKRGISVIGYALAFLYAVSLVAYLPYLSMKAFQLWAAILSVLFIAACVASVGVAMFKGGARRTLVTVHWVMAVYVLGLLLMHHEWVSPGYVFISAVVILFFNQTKIKTQFSAEQRFLKSVLIIDDDPALLKTIKPLLLSSGYSVLTATTGERGLQIAQSQNPDIIVLDVILPGIKGREVCAQLKEDPQTEKIPVIFLTAKDSPDDVRAEIEAGGISHITKPLSSQKLLEEIRKAIGS